jgi:hypothetical protein
VNSGWWYSRIFSFDEILGQPDGSATPSCKAESHCLFRTREDILDYFIAKTAAHVHATLKRNTLDNFKQLARVGLGGPIEYISC